MTRELILKLIDRLQKSAEEKSQEELSYKVEQAKLQLQADKLATKKSLAEAKKNLDAKYTSDIFSPKDIVQLKDSIESLEKGLAALETLESELF